MSCPDLPSLELHPSRVERARRVDPHEVHDSADPQTGRQPVVSASYTIESEHRDQSGLSTYTAVSVFLAQAHRFPAFPQVQLREPFAPLSPSANRSPLA